MNEWINLDATMNTIKSAESKYGVNDFETRFCLVYLSSALIDKVPKERVPIMLALMLPSRNFSVASSLGSKIWMGGTKII